MSLQTVCVLAPIGPIIKQRPRPYTSIYTWHWKKCSFSHEFSIRPLCLDFWRDRRKFFSRRSLGQNECSLACSIKHWLSTMIPACIQLYQSGLCSYITYCLSLDRSHFLIPCANKPFDNSRHRPGTESFLKTPKSAMKRLPGCCYHHCVHQLFWVPRR